MELKVKLNTSIIIPTENASGTHGIGDWVEPRAGLDVATKIKLPPSSGN